MKSWAVSEAGGSVAGSSMDDTGTYQQTSISPTDAGNLSTTLRRSAKLDL